MRGSCGRRSLLIDRRRFVVERIVERPGALDVHKASVTACVRVWEGRVLTEQIAEFQTTVAGLLALGDWLAALGVRQVVMEATGVYWKPIVRHEALFDRVG
jgi:transposase